MEKSKILKRVKNKLLTAIKVVQINTRYGKITAHIIPPCTRNTDGIYSIKYVIDAKAYTEEVMLNKHIESYKDVQISVCVSCSTNVQAHDIIKRFLELDGKLTSLLVPKVKEFGDEHTSYHWRGGVLSVDIAVQGVCDGDSFRTRLKKAFKKLVKNLPTIKEEAEIAFFKEYLGQPVVNKRFLNAEWILVPGGRCIGFAAKSPNGVINYAFVRQTENFFIVSKVSADDSYVYNLEELYNIKDYNFVVVTKKIPNYKVVENVNVIVEFLEKDDWFDLPRLHK